MIRIAPSLLAADYTRLGEEVAQIEAAGAEYLHLDIMDGCFVPPISYGSDFIKALRSKSSMFFDVHLMVCNPWHHLETYARAGADGMTIHVESGGDIAGMLRRIRSYGCKAAIALNPGTPVQSIVPYLTMVDMVLVMSVNPGYGGQKYMPVATEKLRDVRARLDACNPSCLLQVDGGVKGDNIAEILAAGADTIVAGSYVFGAKDRAAAINSLRG